MPYIYLSTAGSDANDGLSPGSPKLTWQAAIDAATSGDTIRVRAGTYNVAAPVTIDGKSLEIIIYTPSKKWSEGILNGPGSGDLLQIQNLGSGQFVRLIGIKFEDAAIGIAVTSQDASSTITAFGCWFDGTLTTGFSGDAGTANAHSCTFENLTTGWSVAASSGIFGCTFFNVTTGISVSGSGTITWKNNAFGGTRTTDVSLPSGTTDVADFNAYTGTPSTSVVTKNVTNHATLSAWNTASSQDASGVDPTSPGFVTESPLDPHLSFGSALKEIGTNIFGTSAQYGNGEFRPETGSDNIGAWKTNTGVGGFNRIKDARTVYVRTTGSDSSGNGTETAPFLTIQTAIDTLKGHAINAAVTIDIGTGTFANSVVIDDELVVSGVEGPAIILSGAGTASTFITGTTSDRVMKIIGGVFVQIKNLKLGPVASTATRYLEIGGKAKVEIVSGSTVEIEHTTTSGEGIAVVSGMLSVPGQLTVDGPEVGITTTFGGILSVPSGGRIDVDNASARAVHMDINAIGEIIGTLDVGGTSVRGLVVERNANLTARSGAVFTTSTSGAAMDVDLGGTVTLVDGVTSTITAGSDGVRVANGSVLKAGGTLSVTRGTQGATSGISVCDGSTLVAGKLTTSEFNTPVTATRNATVELDDADFSVTSSVAVGTWMIEIDEGSYVAVDSLAVNLSNWSNYMRTRNSSRGILTATSRTVTQTSQTGMYRAEKMSSILIAGGTHDVVNSSSTHVDALEFGLMNSSGTPTWTTAGTGTTFRTNVATAGSFDTGTPDGGLAFS